MSMISEWAKLRIAAETCNQMGKRMIAKYLSEAADTIESLHKKLNEKWILCSEEFPSIDGYYEVTVDRDVNGEMINVTEFQYFCGNRGEWISHVNSRFKRKVIAWKYNTEPYEDKNL